MAHFRAKPFGAASETTHVLELDDTELQMVEEALSRAKPFTDLSQALADVEWNLEVLVHNRVAALLERDPHAAPADHKPEGS
jgi:hypothetical protein